MKKFINLTTSVVLVCMLAAMACACSGKSSEEESANESTAAETTVATVAETSSAPVIEPSVAITEATAAETTAAETTAAETTAAETTAATAEETTAATTTVAETTAATTTEAEVTASNAITDEMALDAIQVRCVLANTEFASLSGDHWVIISSDDSQIVVLFTSYTGSENRYYIDRATGNTTVTELVPGIIDEEQPTDESFNVRDYLAAEIYG